RPGHGDGARVRADQAGADAQQSRLAGAVCTDDRRDLSGSDGQVDVTEDLSAAVPLADALRPKEDRAGRPLARRRPSQTLGYGRRIAFGRAKRAVRVLGAVPKVRARV